MKRMLCLLLACISAVLYAQDTVWRVDQRLSESWGYTWDENEPGNWAFHRTEVEENIHYLPDYPDVVDHIAGRKKQTGAGEDGLWHEIPTLYCNPEVGINGSGRIISYDTASEGYNFQREEVYDILGNLSELDRQKVNYGYLDGHHYQICLGYNDRVDSLLIRHYNFNSSSWEKRIMSYDASGRKSAELVLISNDNANWQPLKRATIFQSGQDFPPEFKPNLNHMLFDLNYQGYIPTVLYDWIPGLTERGMVDSLFTEEYVNNEWVLRSLDDYNVYTNPDGSIGYTIYSWDPDMIGTPDYFPSCWAFGFDSLGHYRGHSFSTDDGFSPPSYVGVSYQWSQTSALLDPALAPVHPIRIKTWPNPFRETVQVLLEVPDTKAETRIGIYNLKGQKVFGQDGVGDRWIWDGKDFSGKDPGAGIYFIRAENSGLGSVLKVLKF